MTVREAYEFALIECNKLKAPAMLLEDFVYLFNKAIQQYVNGVYNRCEYNQQSSDDLGWLHTTVTKECTVEPKFGINGKFYSLTLPSDYLHILGCKTMMSLPKSLNHCGDNVGSTFVSQCTRLTADLDSGITNNYYMKPSHKKPYYYITNRDGSQSIEIHVGNSNCELDEFQISYIRKPKSVDLTPDEVYSVVDTSEELEFPNYVCYEIINLYTRLLLENAGDPRLQTHIPINQSIATPGN